MTRSHRSLAWPLVLVLLCASFALAQRPPAAQAADHVYVVDNALDTDLTAATPNPCTAAAKDCSLRQAIKLANSDAGTSQIQLDIPPDENDPDYGYDANAGRWTIGPASPLPPLTENGTEIDGLNQNAGGTPQIVIDGSAITSGGVGLRITSADNKISNLIVVHFIGTTATTGFGIRIDGAAAANNTILGNYIGNLPGGAAAPNQLGGVLIDNGAHDNFVGLGSSPGSRNVISGNGNINGSVADGIKLQNAPNNTIQGNYIGLGLNSNFSTLVLPNTGNGINIIDTSGTTVGGAQSNLRNIISGNNGDGVVMTGSGASGNKLIGNYIGVSELGSADIGNGGNGVQIADGAAANEIYSAAGAGSAISGNGGYGVLITDRGTERNRVYGNYIGVSAGGGTARPNDAGGVRIREDASNNLIGLSSQGNVISGNTGYGVSIGRVALGFTAIFSNTISGNIIGLNPLATAPISNTLGGVLIADGATSSHIGGAGDAGNVISGNGGPGLTIGGSGVISATVSGNIIGLRRAATNGPLTTVEGNSRDGVLVDNGAQDVLVGGSAAEANTIAGNSGNGIHVVGDQTRLVTIAENSIGVAFSSGAFVPAGNEQNGVLVDGGAQQVSILRNHISSNTLKGIALDPNAPAPNGSASNANHDIDPPFDIHVNQNGQVTGRVLAAGAPDACAAPCTVQIFSADPAALDGQGRNLLDQQVTSNGYFTATFSGLPAQLALTATDKDGNTSEFTATQEIAIGPIDLREASPDVQDAAPGQVVTYTHELVNNGSVDLLNLKVKALSSRNWDVATVPISGTLFSLAAGESKLVTVTLQLPFSPDERVLTGPPPDQTVVSVTSTDYVTITDTVTDTTNILPTFLLDVTPQASSGVGAPDSPNSVVRYVHTLTNKGNVAGTVLISAVTDRAWETSVSSDTVTLEPGDVKNVTVSVAVPSGAAANSTPAKTTVMLTVPDAPGQNKIVTDTTSVELTPSALLIHTGEADAQAGAGGTATFLYKVQNRSNGVATFSLSGHGNFNETQVTFKRLDGQPFGAGNSFTLGNTKGADELEFIAEVRLDPSLRTGDVETVTIQLHDDKNQTRAAAQDHITIKGAGPSPFETRLYLPLVSR